MLMALPRRRMPDHQEPLHEELEQIRVALHQMSSEAQGPQPPRPEPRSAADNSNLQVIVEIEAKAATVERLFMSRNGRSGRLARRSNTPSTRSNWRLQKWRRIEFRAQSTYGGNAFCPSLRARRSAHSGRARAMSESRNSSPDPKAQSHGHTAGSCVVL